MQDKRTINVKNVYRHWVEVRNRWIYRNLNWIPKQLIKYLTFLLQLIVERYYKERSLPTLDKSKFLVPEDITMSQFLVIIRNRIKVKPNQVSILS